MRKIFSIILVFVIMASLTTNAFASTQKVEIPVRSCLLIDRSGSIKDQAEVNEKMNQYNLEMFDFVGYFDDQQISTDPSYAGGGDSHLCETIDQMISHGFQRIVIITDGEQYPLGDYSSLGLYTDIYLSIDLVGKKTQVAEEFTNALAERMENSTLQVTDPNGTMEFIENDFERNVFEIEIPDPAPVEEEDHNCKCYWWIALILGALIAAIFDFIHELLTRRLRGDLIKKIRKAKVLADFSGSMSSYKAEVKRNCKAARYKKPVMIFSGCEVREISLAELLTVESGGQTPGWEAVAEAYQQGEENIVIISDLGFNGMSFDEAAGWHFKEITLVVPNGGHDVATENEMRKIADKVEVICL